MEITDDSLVLCIHIGASSLHVGIAQANGHVLLAQEILEPTEQRARKEYSTLVDETASLVAKVLNDARDDNLPLSRLVGTGVVLPMPVDAETGIPGRAPAATPLTGRPLKKDLQSRIQTSAGINLPVWIENDGNGACLAEWFFGLGNGHRNFITIILCTGLGAGMVLNNDLYRGHNKTAGEVGHIIVRPEGAACGCGSRGCLETVAAGGAMVKKTRALGIPLAAKPNLHYRDLIDAARNGSKEVLSLFATMGKYLGLGIASIINVLNPSRVILCGQLLDAQNFFLPSAQKELSNRVFSGFDCNVLVSRFAKHAEILSALSTFLYYQGKRPS